MTITVPILNQFLTEHFPDMHHFGRVQSIKDEEVVFRLRPQKQHLRPGGTVSGPTMMALADTAAWCALLHQIGLEAFAVTTNLNINFLRKPAADADLDAIGTVLKLGRKLAVTEVSLMQNDTMVAHATCTYSLPSRSSVAR